LSTQCLRNIIYVIWLAPLCFCKPSIDRCLCKNWRSSWIV